MAAKPSRFGAVLRAVKWIGPLAIAAITRVAKDPEMLATVKEQATRLGKGRGSSADDALETIRVLREQVTYLAGSADDEQEAQRAKAWGQQLDRCEHAAQILAAPGASKTDRSALAKRIGTLRSEIFSAFILEKAEDAEQG